MVPGEDRRGNSKSQAGIGTKLTPWQERGQPSRLQGSAHMWSEGKRCPITPFESDSPPSSNLRSIFTCFPGCALNPAVWSMAISTTL